MVLSESNDVSEPNKSDTEQAKIDVPLEQQRRKTETSIPVVLQPVPPLLLPP
jgi:hypothetical protein